MPHKYNLLERCLHWLALEPAAVRALSFDLECMHALPRKAGEMRMDQVADRPVYVCGLARSGTTMLLNLLDELNCFSSLSYRDMPFVLAPNLWRKVSQFSKRKEELAARAHGDGMLVGYDSPESFEEVFWRTFSDTASCSSAGYGAENVSPEALKQFADYRMVITNPRSQRNKADQVPRRYLSKNNNNLLRLKALSANPSATVLLVYRNPVDTAKSLHRLHVQFCQQAQHDSFTRRYMGWLGHHEFGLGHLPFTFAQKQMDSALSPLNLDYWVDYWCAVYEHVLNQQEVAFSLVSHDHMRSAPAQMLAGILALLDVKGDVQQLASKVRSPEKVSQTASMLNPQLLEKAEAIFASLTCSPKNILNPQRVN